MGSTVSVPDLIGLGMSLALAYRTIIAHFSPSFCLVGFLKPDGSPMEDANFKTIPQGTSTFVFHACFILSRLEAHYMHWISLDYLDKLPQRLILRSSITQGPIFTIVYPTMIC